MKLVKEFTTRTYKYNELGVATITLEEIKHYYYKDEEEKMKHAKRMADRGFKDSGQVRENIGTLMKPEYVWFGSYYRFERINK